MLLMTEVFSMTFYGVLIIALAQAQGWIRYLTGS